jgi:thiamine biosynthesis lipoprotein ApbE
MMESAAAGQVAPAHADWTALGTQVRLLVTDPAQLAAGRDLLAADLAAVDAACSRFRPDSELMRLDDAGRPPGPVQLSPLLAEAVAVALRAARLTDGDVDPTIGDALAVIGYDRDFALVPADGPPVTLTVRAAPGWRLVGLDEQHRHLTLPPGMSLDLGATAKAWAADRSAARLAAELGCGVLVGLGGDIAVAGPVPDGGWRIRVQDVTGRRGGHPGRRAGHVQHHGPALAARRHGAAPHPRPAHRAARPGVLAHRVGRRGQLRRREHGQHRRHHQGRAGARLAGKSRLARPAGGRSR